MKLTLGKIRLGNVDILQDDIIERRKLKMIFGGNDGYGSNGGGYGESDCGLGESCSDEDIAWCCSCPDPSKLKNVQICSGSQSGAEDSLSSWCPEGQATCVSMWW